MDTEETWETWAVGLALNNIEGYYNDLMRMASGIDADDKPSVERLAYRIETYVTARFNESGSFGDIDKESELKDVDWLQIAMESVAE
jgi:hypothetical protein